MAPGHYSLKAQAERYAAFADRRMPPGQNGRPTTILRVARAYGLPISSQTL